MNSKKTNDLNVVVKMVGIAILGFISIVIILSMMTSAKADYILWDKLDNQMSTYTVGEKSKQCKLCDFYKQKVKEYAKVERQDYFRHRTMVFYVRAYSHICKCEDINKTTCKIDLPSRA